MVYHKTNDGRGDEKPKNVFRNDGSFLEMFKKLQETGAVSQEGSSSTTESGGNVNQSQSTETKDKVIQSESKPSVSRFSGMVGKRRGGRVLPTGKVKKVKIEGQVEEEVSPKDAWSLYLAEVKKYKQTTCEEEDKRRPLVK
uniref:Telomerase RNA component interacting RNase n=1 Tax=Clastoptera arizonana TaxID=38151 RepID=A0A1B6EF72_9HEMI